MGLLREMVKSIVPAGVRDRARDGQRRRLLRRAMADFLRLPPGAPPSDALLNDLVVGWGNPGWSAQPNYMRAFVARAAAATGPILECGSGLSTLLLGHAARRAGVPLWTLEHHDGWAVRVSNALKQFGIDGVELCVADLQNYGDYHWYAPPLRQMPAAFDLVVCDGPPGRTPGGRYGFLPVLGDRLAAGGAVLLDDAARPDERAVAERWAAEAGLRLSVEGAEKPYAVLTREG